MRNRSFRVIFIFLITLLWCTSSICAEKEPRPNDDLSVASFFGNLNETVFSDTEPAPEWKEGQKRNFHVLDIASGVINYCTGRIFLITDNIVFWYDTDEFQPIPEYLAETLKSFDAQTLPMLRKTFGSEDNPGIDNDSRFHVLFTDKIGTGYNGYFSSEDTEDRRLRPVSNAMELVFLNTRLVLQGASAVLDTLSHEYQHMVHNHYDRNENSFINEGLSGLAEYLAVGSIDPIFIQNYLSNPGRSLIWWPDSGLNHPYYGSSFLFSVYLYDRFGEDFIRDLVVHSENGLNGIDKTLQNFNLPWTADDLFQQWTAAILGELTHTPVQQWNYHTYVFPQNNIYRDITTLTCEHPETHETGQYGIRFYKSGCSGPFRITITGSADSPITALKLPGGENAWWSGAVSNSMAILSHDFDLSAVNSPIFFEYDANFDIEENYDFYYLLIRDADGNVSRLEPSSATDYNPTQANFGKGSTGSSKGTIHESIDLSSWAGQNVRLSFVYLTDTAAVADGLLLDNFRIDTIGFYDDAETDGSGWEAEGFSRIQSVTPQHFSLVVLHPQSDGTAAADLFKFEGGKPFSVDCPEGNCSFAVSAVDREIRSRTSFSVQTTPLVIPTD